MAPPRRWDPPAGGAKRLLDAFAAAPWMTPSGLDTLSQTRVPPELAGTVVAEQPALEAPRLPADYVGVLRGAARSATQLRGVLAEGDRLAEDHDTAVLRSAAATWIGNLDAGRTYVQQVRQWVNGDRAKVKLIGRGVVTFSGERGTIPVTISNGLSRPIKIRPTITPLGAGKLRARSPELLTIAAGRKKEVRIPAEAGEDGVIRVSVELRDAAGNRYGDPFFLGVRVTNYGSVGLIVVLGGGGLLFAVAIVRNVRRVRRHRDRVRGQSAARHDAATRTEDAEEPVQL
jgi:hypothetical protein